MSSISLLTKFNMQTFVGIFFFGEMTFFDLNSFVSTITKTAPLMKLPVVILFNWFLKKEKGYFF